MTDSGESTEFSDTESKDENEEAKVSDPISNHDGMEKVNNQKNEDASGTSSENITSADLTAGYNAIFNPSVSNSANELSLNSRDKAEHTRCKKITKKNKTKRGPENSPMLTLRKFLRTCYKKAGKELIAVYHANLTR